MAEYLLTKFYLKKKEESEKKKIPGEFQAKMRVVMDVINKNQEADFEEEEL